MTLPNGYFQSLSEPHIVRDTELDEVLATANLAITKIENPTSGHNHDGASGGRKIVQVTHIHLTKVCFGGGAENKIKFHIGFLDPTVAEGGVTILGGITRRVGLASIATDGPGATDSAVTGLVIGDHSLVIASGQPGSAATTDSDGSHDHTITVGSHTHSLAINHAHEFVVQGGAFADPAVYIDAGGTVRKVGAGSITSPAGVAIQFTDPASDTGAAIPSGSASTEGAHTHDISPSEVAHTHTLTSGEDHSITDTGHTHVISDHTHALTQGYLGSDSQTPSIMMDGSYSVPWDTSTPQTGNKSMFTVGVHELDITVAQDCEIQISIAIKGTIA